MLKSPLGGMLAAEEYQDNLVESAKDYVHQALLQIRDNLIAMNRENIQWYPEREDLADFFEDATGLNAQAVSQYTDEEILDSISWT